MEASLVESHLPVTALSSVTSRDAEQILLIASGPRLRVQRLGVYRIFLHQAIHGVKPTLIREEPQDKDAWIWRREWSCLVFGGRSIALVSINLLTSGHSFDGIVRVKQEEEQLPGWILDACFYHGDDFQSHLSPSKAVCVAADDALYELSFAPGEQSGTNLALSSRCLVRGPECVLYSAEVRCLCDEITVVAGTIFGDVIVWLFSFNKSTSDPSKLSQAHILHYFHGHEGSVFGVALSNKISLPPHGQARKLLASCSDDRTVRIWAVSDSMSVTSTTAFTGMTGFHTELLDTMGKSPCVGSAMGHASRIWKVKFLEQGSGPILLLSFGEDATMQVWTIIRSDQRTSNEIMLLEHVESFCHHLGKNIWSAAAEYRQTHLIDQTQRSWIPVWTGGGDGRVIQSRVATSSPDLSGMNFTTKTTEMISNSNSSRTGAHLDILSVFWQMAGIWNLHRVLRSARPEFPSGTFRGSATLIPRRITDTSFQGELLYSEQGEFTGDTGQVINARRSYVYRLASSDDRMSCWFVKSNDNITVDYLFHELSPFVLRHDRNAGSANEEVTKASSHPLDGTTSQASTPDQAGHAANGSNSAIVEASAHHLCVQDDYDASYSFVLDQHELRTWKLRYDVKGPGKDYLTLATFSQKTPLHDIPTGDHVFTVVFRPSYRFPNVSCKSYAWSNAGDLLAISSSGELTTLNFEEFDINLQHQLVSPTRQYEVEFKPNSPGKLDFVRNVEGIKGGFMVLSSGGKVYCVSSETAAVSYLAQDSRILMVVEQVSNIFCSGGRHAETYKSQAGSSHFRPKAVVLATYVKTPVASLWVCRIDTPSLKEVDVLGHFLLVLPSAFSVTSCCLDLDSVLVFGSRSGGLAIWQNPPLSNQSSSDGEKHVARFENIHAHETVTSVRLMPGSYDNTKENDTSSGRHDVVHYLLTTGRDGRCAVHCVRLEFADGTLRSVALNTIHEIRPPFGQSIEGTTAIDFGTPQIQIYGFSGKDFVVWNPGSAQETWRVDCGGPHRSWAYRCAAEAKPVHHELAWTRQSRVHVKRGKWYCGRTVELDDDGGNTVGHGREIKALAVTISPFKHTVKRKTEPNFLIATGAEDTLIHLSRFDGKHFWHLAQLVGHTTGVQQLKWSDGADYLFSAGGKEELLFWRLQPVPHFEVGVVCIGRCPAVSEDGDLRIMGLDVTEILSDREESRSGRVFLVSVAYSDSSLRVWRFDDTSHGNMFTLLSSARHGTRCLTHMAHLRAHNLLMLAVTSTDGSLSLWPVSGVSVHYPAPGTSEMFARVQDKVQIRPRNATVTLHQSAIKSLAHSALDDGFHLLATGGDDNALAITHLQLTPDQPDRQARVLSKLLIPKAHASAINGLAISPGTADLPHDRPFTVCTSGNDQRLKTWRITLSRPRGGQPDPAPAPPPAPSPAIKVERGQNQPSTIADASALAISSVHSNASKTSALENGKDMPAVFIVGIGIEVWDGRKLGM